MASKKKLHSYKDTKHSSKLKHTDTTVQANASLDTPQHHAEDRLPEERLHDTITRLSYNTTQQITFLVVLNELILFLKKYKSDIIQFFFILAVVFVCGNLLLLSLKNPLWITGFAIKICYFLATLVVGMRILRKSAVGRSDKEQKSQSLSDKHNFFYGFFPFMGLHIAICLLGLMSVVAVDYCCDYIGYNPQKHHYIFALASITALSLSTSLLLTRFSFVLPETLFPNDKDILSNFPSQVEPFLKPLFILLFCAKFTALNLIMFSDVILLQMLGFVGYHIFVYSLLGASFKLYSKVRVTP